MDYIRCGEPNCQEMASIASVEEMAKLTGGMMGGLFPHPRAYKCPSGHTTLTTECEHFKESLQRKADRPSS
jgi:hypothetical protein